MNLIQNLKRRPAILNGLIAAAVLLVTKLVLLFSGNWMFRVEGTYNFVSFVIIFVAMLLGGNGEKKLRSEFGFFKAWLSSMVTIIIAVIGSQIGDQIAYRANKNLAQHVKEYQIEQLQKSLPKMKFISADLKEEMMQKLEDADPKEIYSIAAFFSNVFTFFALDALWGLLVAAITRKSASSGISDDMAPDETV